MGKAFVSRRGGESKAPTGCYAETYWDLLVGSGNVPSPQYSNTFTGNTISAPTSDFQKIYFTEVTINATTPSAQTQVLSGSIVATKGVAQNIFIRSLGTPTYGGYVKLYLHINADGSFYEYVDCLVYACSTAYTRQRFESGSVLIANYV